MRVSEIVENYRSALIAVLPSVEYAGIPWRRPDSYDEWDAIASVLYESLVVAPLRWGLEEQEQHCFEMPKYDLLLESYAGLSWIEVLGPTPDKHMFHAFGTAREPFDIVEIRSVGESGHPEKEGLQFIPLSDVSFRLRHRTTTGRIELLDEIGDF